MSAEMRDEGFLKRWSRLKTDSRTDAPREEPKADAAAGRVLPDAPHTTQRPTTQSPPSEPPALPPVESLTMASDYRAFFHPKIDEGLRRAALKKLFADPHFNVMDGLDVYIDDYSVSEPLAEAALAELEQAKKILAWAREDAEERARLEKQAIEPHGDAVEKPRMLPISGDSEDNAPTREDGDAKIAGRPE